MRALSRAIAGCLLIGGLMLSGCHRGPMVTAVPLSPWNQCEPHGIPYYLPKPLLVVAKNVRHINEAQVGLTEPVPIPNTFDNQAGFADLKANVTIPTTTSTQGNTTTTTTTTIETSDSSGGVPEGALAEQMIPPGGFLEKDSFAQDSFFTYQIIFVPDLSQKYGLRVRGGPGEIRAAMNLVNGWMYTGMGPYYLKDSSTAQNMMAAGVGSMYAGRGVADVLNEVGELAQFRAQGGGDFGGGEGYGPAAEDVVNSYEKLYNTLSRQEAVPQTMLNYAEIYIYEPILTPEGQTCWNLIASHTFDRQFFRGEMGSDNLRLFEKIIESQNLHSESVQAAARANMMVIPSPSDAPPRPDAETSEHGEGSFQGFSPGADAVPPPGAAPAPAPLDVPAGEVFFDDLGREILRIPASPTATSPGYGTHTDVDVHVDAAPDEDVCDDMPHLLDLFHHCEPAATPQYESRSRVGTATIIE